MSGNVQEWNKKFPDIPMSALLDINKAVDYSQYFTNDQLMTMFFNLKNAVHKRCVRRNAIESDYYDDYLSKYLKNAFKEAGPEYECISDSFFAEFTPPYVETSTEDFEGKNIYPRINISFSHGEPLSAKRFVYDDVKTAFNNNYSIRIEYNVEGDEYMLTIKQPIQCVSKPPYQNWQHCDKIIEKGTAKYFILGGTKNITAGVGANEISYDILPKIISFYVEKGHMETMMDNCRQLKRTFNKSFSVKAKSATLCFLIIGRFRFNYIPYDVIKLIAKKVWDSRFTLSEWGVGNIPTNGEYNRERKDCCSYDEDSIHRSVEESEYGWKPFHIPPDKYITSYYHH